MVGSRPVATGVQPDRWGWGCFEKAEVRGNKDIGEVASYCSVGSWIGLRWAEGFFDVGAFEVPAAFRCSLGQYAVM